MEATVVTLIELMVSTTVGFLSSFIGSLWGLFLSLGVLAFAGGYILRKTGIGRR